MAEIFQITNGTETIDFLDPTVSGVRILEWSPAIAQAKGSGVYQDSPLAEGRKLIDRKFNSITEELSVAIVGNSQDDMIANQRSLIEILELGANYWLSTYSSTPVYLKAQLENETNPRYALVINYTLEEIPFPYSGPIESGGFQGNTEFGSVLTEMSLSIEHGHWTSNTPGNGTCVEVSTEDNWNYKAYWYEVSTTPAQTPRSLLETANGYIYAGEDGQILRSTDGETFSVNTTLPSSLVNSMIQLSNGYILAGDQYQILRSINDGGAWSVVKTGIDDYVTALLQTSSGRVLAGSQGDELWKSDDNGGTWTQVTGLPSLWGAAADNFAEKNGVIYAGTGYSFWKSTDDGDTWTQISFLKSAPPFTIFKFALSTDETFFLAGDTGLTPTSIYISYDNCVTWRTLKSDFTNGIGAIEFDTDNGVYIGDQDSIEYSPDLNTWYSYAPGGTTLSLLYAAVNPAVYAGSALDLFKKNLETVSVGVSDTSCSSGDVIVGNRHSFANITDIKVYDASGTSYTDIFPMSSFPTNILPSSVAAGDMVYFGSSTSVDNHGPFSGLVFDLTSIALVPSYSTIWQYWSGSGWSTLDVMDNTDLGAGCFTKDGVGSVHWDQPSNWAANTIDGVEAFWVRANISNVFGSPASPKQNNQQIYAISSARMRTSDVSGDIPAFAEIKIHNRSDFIGPDQGQAPQLWSNRILLGIRSTNRGADFRAYLNFSDNHNLPGVKVTEGPAGSFADDSTSPTGRAVVFSTGGSTTYSTVANMKLGLTLAKQYYGSYRAFLRVKRTTGSATDATFYVTFKSGSGGVSYNTEERQAAITKFMPIDLGRVVFPVAGSLAQTEVGDILEISVVAKAAGAVTLKIYDLILIPTDEWSVDSIDRANVADSDVGRSSYFQKYLDIDSITRPKETIRSIVKRDIDESVTSIWIPVSVGPAILQTREQDIWFLFMQTSQTGSSYSWVAPPELACSVQLYKNQRYLSLRGSG